MFNRIAAVAAAPQRVEPTSLLMLVAGEFAPRVARRWPGAHAEFLTAPAARRHLVCVALAFGRDLAALGETLLRGRLRRAIPAAVGDAAPAGLGRALGRLGEVAWASDEYRMLLRLLAQPKPAKVLRHAASIEADVVRRLALLPPPMGEAAALALTLSGDDVAVLREAYDVLRFRVGESRAGAAAAGWAAAGSAKALFEAVRDDLYPEPEPPPHPGTARLRPLASKAALKAAARRYRNCLGDQLPYAASGWSAYYEWVVAPGAVVEVSRDAMFGWRLEQARLASNEPVPEAVREAIVSELALMGIHVGRSSWELERALAAAGGRAFPLRPVQDAVAEAFGGEG